jgi:hypothetical protein
LTCYRACLAKFDFFLRFCEVFDAQALKADFIVDLEIVVQIAEWMSLCGALRPKCLLHYFTCIVASVRLGVLASADLPAAIHVRIHVLLEKKETANIRKERKT